MKNKQQIQQTYLTEARKTLQEQQHIFRNHKTLL